MGCVLDVVRALYSIKRGDVEKIGGETDVSLPLRIPSDSIWAFALE